MTDIDQAVRSVAGDFPFPGYIRPESGGHANVAATVRRLLPPGTKVLDFGAGPADKTAVVQALGFECTAVDDLADAWVGESEQEQIRAFCERRGIDLLVTEPGGPVPPLEPGGYDMLMLHDVLEHLHDSPRLLLIDLLEAVTAGGLLYVTVPNVANIRKRLHLLRGLTNAQAFEAYYWSRGPWRGHVREYSKRDLELLASYLDLEIVELHGCHHMLEKVPPRLLPLYRSATRVAPGWSDTWQLVARKPATWSPRRDLSDAEHARETAKLSRS